MHLEKAIIATTSDQYDRKQGVWQMYSASNLLIAEINYLNDKKHGLSTRYYPHSGTVMEQAEYFDGRFHGGYKKYFYTGSLKTEGDYDFNKRTGYWVNYYHTTGEISSEGSYEKGKKHGEWKFYDSKGQLKYSYTYKAGVLDSEEWSKSRRIEKTRNREKSKHFNPKVRSEWLQKLKTRKRPKRCKINQSSTLISTTWTHTL
jgi:antitoxin component YwqK of YwqJK toxin-antitoxin module